MNIKILTLVLVLSPLFISNAHAVRTANCPDQIQMEIDKVSAFFDAAILRDPMNVNLKEEALAGAIKSRDHLISLINYGWSQGEFTIRTKMNGKCYYSLTKADADLEDGKLQLYTWGGDDWMTLTLVSANKTRKEESFMFSAKLRSYSPEKIELRAGEVDITTTVFHDCYDRKCLADAKIGLAELSTDGREIVPSVGFLEIPELN